LIPAANLRFNADSKERFNTENTEKRRARRRKRKKERFNTESTERNRGHREEREAEEGEWPRISPTSALK
jgi:hypothetical protein